MPLRNINGNYSFDEKSLKCHIVTQLEGRLCSPFNPSQYISVCNYNISIRFLIDILLKRRTTVPTSTWVIFMSGCSM